VIIMNFVSDSPSETESDDVRRIGLGRLMLSAEMVEQTIAQLLAVDPAADMKAIIRRFQLLKGLNQLLVDIGIAEIRSASQPSETTRENIGVRPFPGGTPIAPPSGQGRP
jgi:hypothetical protein